MEGLISSNRFHCRVQITENLAKQLAKMPGLEVIQFHDVKPDLQTLYHLNELVFKGRKDITLRVYGYGGSWQDIGFLQHLPELERFDWESDEFLSVKPLYQLKKLVHLGMGFANPKQKLSVAFLADFTSTLDSIRLQGDYKDFLTTVPKLSEIKTVWLSSMKLKGFDCLAGLPIETLGNYGGRVGSFDFVSQLRTLKRVWIKTNATLDKFDFISELPLLQEIERYYVSKLVRFPKCDHLQNLVKVIASDCNRLVDISEVLKLKKCKIALYGKQVPGRCYRAERTS